MRMLTVRACGVCRMRKSPDVLKGANSETTQDRNTVTELT